MIVQLMLVIHTLHKFQRDAEMEFNTETNGDKDALEGMYELRE